MNRVGIGIDVHAFASGRKLIIGGVEIPHEKGLEGHSDADALAHAIADALLGAAALGDIGKFYPDTDMEFKNMDSMVILREVAARLRTMGATISNVDATVIAQAPKLAPHIPSMQAMLAGQSRYFFDPGGRQGDDQRAHRIYRPQRGHCCHRRCQRGNVECYVSAILQHADPAQRGFRPVESAAGRHLHLRADGLQLRAHRQSAGVHV